MRFLIRILISTLAVYISAAVVPGINIETFVTALVASVVLGILNTLIKPILVVLTLPVNIITLGLFTLVINASLVLLASYLVPGFHVESFWSALLFSIVLSVVSGFLHVFA